MRDNSAFSSGPALAGWVLTVLLAVGGFVFVHGNRANIPLGDEILWLPYITGEQRVTLQWLWSQHNDHRLLIPRLLYIGLWHLRPHSFKLAMYFGFVCLVLATVVMLVVSMRLRSKPSYFDCLFPLLFLNPGNAENFLSGYNSVCNILTVTAVVALIGLVMVDGELQSRLARFFAIGTVVCLPVITGTGTLLALPASIALAYAGVLAFRKGAVNSRPAAASLWAAGLVVLAIVALHAVTGNRQQVPHSSVKHMVLNALKVLTMSFGPFLQEQKQYWPYCFVLVATVGIVTLCFSIEKFRKEPQERVRLTMLWAIVFGLVVAAAVIGYSRTYLGIDAGLQTRYSLLWAPLLCCLYLAMSIAGSAAWAEFSQFVLFLAVAASFGMSSEVGWTWRDQRNAYFDTIAAGVRMGWTQSDLVDATRERKFVYPDPAFFDEFFQRLRAAGLAPFDQSLSTGAGRPRTAFGSGEASLRGNVDACAYDGTGYRITGWAVCDAATPGFVTLVLDGQAVVGTSERQSRADVEQAVGVSEAGFLLVAPPRVEGKRLVLHARCGNALQDQALPGTFTCSSRPR